uniref:Uncharacterized protein n=1 Tax=Rhizophora mucronata TaxID=61149 RepID=A0A2P2JVJ6_RHIMU
MSHVNLFLPSLLKEIQERRWKQNTSLVFSFVVLVKQSNRNQKRFL